MEASELQGTVFDVFTVGRQTGLMFRDVEDQALDGRQIVLGGRSMISFGSCSYLGLEVDDRIRAGIIRATERYGSQFSASRAYLSAPPYAALEEKLSALFGHPALITSSTTLGHLGVVPVLCQEKDAIILDQQVHHSVQLGATLARANGCHVELVRHGDYLELERRIEALRQTHRKVWHMIDGVYSMYGDLPDVAALTDLLNRYEQLHLYVDDAHGMSIAGENGRGVHLSRMPLHPRMVLATSLNKAFAASGGCIVTPDPELRHKLRLCASTLAFCGPIQPPMLGAIDASASIHLSPDITRYQQELAERVKHLNNELLSRDLPLLENNLAPILFIKTGPLKVAHALIRRLMDEGFYVSVATYPAVPLKRSGLRVSLTRHHALADLTALAQAIQHHYPLALDEAGTTRDQVESLFSYRDRLAAKQQRRKLERVFELDQPTHVSPHVEGLPPEIDIQLQYASSIAELDAAEWDSLLGHRGAFPASQLAMLEKTFRGRPEAESNWTFHYFIVRMAGRPIAATFFSEALWKDDMLMRADVSKRIEERRAEDPYFLTSRVLAMGSLLSEGNHLYIDRTGPWRTAMELILNEAAQIMQVGGAKLLVVRDLPDGDPELAEYFLAHGLVKMPMLASHTLELGEWKTETEFLQTLGQRTRRRVRADALAVQPQFTTRIWRHDGERPSAQQFAQLYALYRNVKQRKLRLNTFDLPRDVFERLWETPGWEIQTLHLLPEHGGPADGSPVAMGASLVNGDRYVAFACGLDGIQREVSVYRQLLWRTILRAKELGLKYLDLGMDAEVEKTRLGAIPHPQCAYVQLTDHFNAEILGQVVQDVSFSDTSSLMKAS